MTQPPFWQPAEDRKQLWRTILGLFLVMFIWVLATFAISFAAVSFLPVPPDEVANGSSQIGAFAMFSTFFGFHIGLAIVLPLLHKRSYFSLFGPDRQLNGKHFRRGVLATLAVFVLITLISLLEPAFLPSGMSPPAELNQPLQSWAIGVIPALFLVFMQSLAEELVFRGYLLQQLHARFRSPLLWAVLPALIFGALHFDPFTFGMMNATATVLNAALVGTLAAFITVRTGNIGAAVGLHFGNNASVVLLGQADHLSGFSLFTVEMDPTGSYMTYSLIMSSLVMFVAFMLWWRWMARHRPIANDAGAA
ncbi:MAG: type II CAAX endopeptidase family protein [Maritimibacter sp.]